ncbi:MAG: T9SS type A sorting domain-containing protein [Bacteroidetes bacterium]|nr:T9SS type A sorting domain-containing protein [Bacteroidota bacterium]
MDTAGLPPHPNITDLAMDTSGGVYVTISGSGLFYKSAQAANFSKVTTLAPNYLNNLSINAGDRIIVSYANIYISYDHAQSWDSITNFPGGQITQDAKGNIYNWNGISLGLSTDTGLSWSRIDRDLICHDLDTLHHVYMSGLTGDSILYAQTIWGVYQSQDHGDHWLATTGTGSVPLDYWRYTDGRQVISNKLGVFVKDANAPGWTKTFPPDSLIYLPVERLQGDTAGNLYIVYRYQNSNVIFTSTDRGNQWLPDTAGFSVYSAAIAVPQITGFSVMENGDVLFAEIANLGAGFSPFVTMKKIKGGAFIMDTAGMTRRDFMFSSGPVYEYASDHSGSYYMSTGGQAGSNSPYMWKQPANGGVWSADTVHGNGSLLSTPALTVLDYDQRHSVLACDPLTGIFTRANQRWQSIPGPQASLLGTYSGINYIAGDSGGAIFAGLYRWRDRSTDWIGGGVVCSHDTGMTWSVVPGLDSIFVVRIKNFGDTTYVLARSGLYKMTCAGNIVSPTEIDEKYTDKTVVTFYPNPAMERCAVYAAGTDITGCRVAIYNSLGESAGIKILDAGHSFGVYDLPAGVYICQLVKDNLLLSTRKLVITRE